MRARHEAAEEDMRFFERTFRRFDFSTMRMLHFPPVEDFSPDKCTRDGDALRIGEHTDFGMVTLLFHDAESAGEGLQVKKADAGAGNDASGGRHKHGLDRCHQPRWRDGHREHRRSHREVDERRVEGHGSQGGGSQRCGRGKG